MADLLVVDDDLDLADAFAEILRVLGHEVRLARNGREGLARLAEARPDLIVCDVEMPILSGPEMALEILLRDAGLEQIPILLTSGVPDLARIARRVGTPYVLSKPFSVQQLVRTLNLALSERRAPRPGDLAGDAP